MENISSVTPLEEEEDQSSEEEEGGLDWSKLPGVVRPVIPKRGEKDFEPKPGGGSGLQVHVLHRARSAMFDALKGTRATSSKAISYAVWRPSIARAHVTVARGIHFSVMGHSAPRPSSVTHEGEKAQKHLELLPEEAIYLVERGSLFCWKENDLGTTYVPGLTDVPGPPMSVQQAYSEMIGIENLTLEKFQVYAYLKRLGYSVTRTDPPNSFYPTPPIVSFTETNDRTRTTIGRIMSFFPLWISRLSRFVRRHFDWWRPVRLSHWLHHDKNYASLFRSLRFLPSGHTVPLLRLGVAEQSDERRASPYQIFYNLYKPSTAFKKSAPPQPDFQIVVINARTTPMPTLYELTDLFGVLPELPPPLPRQRGPLPYPASSLHHIATPSPAMPQLNQVPLIRRLFPWVFPRQPPPTGLARRPNPFMALKAGKKTIVIAVVDAGSISFFRFGEGGFTEWPMA